MTKEAFAECIETIKRTGGNREALFSTREIPEAYTACKDRIERREMVLQFPEVDAPVRVIVSASKEREEKCPLHINMHGGGFILPQNEDDDMYCAHIAVGIKGIVVDIDYATSDQHPFPAALNQSYAVVKWAYEHCDEWNADVNRVSIGGHSAGGNLVEAICLKASQNNDFKICLQILDYAATDNDLALHLEGAERMQAFSKLYSDGNMELLKDPLVSPAFATVDMLCNQPEALIISAKECPFYSVNKEYGMKLVDAGCKVTFKTFLKSRHGFSVRLLDEWVEAQELVIHAINEASL